jgi:hypothetical protein
MQVKYGIFTHYLRGVNDIAGDATGEFSQTSWITSVYAFDADAYAREVDATGASYVVFTIGQTDGYYCMGSNIFELATNQPGYCSQRNLLMDIYYALQRVNPNIKLMVYLASEGPWGAPEAISGTSGFNCAGGLGPQHADFRAKFNAMVTEWSLAMGNRIAGWWLDGTQTYWDTIQEAGKNPAYYNPADGSNGLDNLNALIAACRAGNPNAVVGCNTIMRSSGPDGYTTQADFTAGETNRFCRTPLSPTVPVTDLGGTTSGTLQWNVTSYLGTTWAESSATSYTNLQLANYVYFVCKNKGSLMIDMGIYRNGSLAPAQKAQMSVVKQAVLIDKTYTDFSFQSGPGVITDLAAFKPSWFMSNYGNYELPINGLFKYMSYGNDANIAEGYSAQSGGEWDYNYTIDLGDPKTFNYFALTMPSASFGTHCVIEGSSDNATWSVMKDLPNSVGDRQENFFNALYSYRYVRVRAITPNGSGQPGSQFAIAEFELYRF